MEKNGNPDTELKLSPLGKAKFGIIEAQHEHIFGPNFEGGGDIAVRLDSDQLKELLEKVVRQTYAELDRRGMIVHRFHYDEDTDILESVEMLCKNFFEGESGREVTPGDITTIIDTTINSCNAYGLLDIKEE